jgi:hypothetical protein
LPDQSLWYLFFGLPLYSIPEPETGMKAFTAENSIISDPETVAVTF